MMKKLLVGMLVLLMALSACTTTGGTETEEPTATTTEESLPPAPTAVEEPTAEPTATDEPTSTPEPTETAVPTATEAAPTEEAEAQQTPTTQVPQSEGAIPVEVEIPEGAVIVFTQRGGFMGLDDTWVFYPDGRVTLNDVAQTPLPPGRIDELVNDLALQGFFETTYTTEPNTFCCDFFDYTLAVQTAENQNYVSYSDGDPNLPQNLLDITTLMREIIEEAQVR